MANIDYVDIHIVEGMDLAFFLEPPILEPLIPKSLIHKPWLEKKGSHPSTTPL